MCDSRSIRAHNSWPAVSIRPSGITISGSIKDQRLVVEGKLSDEGHGPCNIQVVFAEYSSETAFVLCDEEGEFFTVPVAASMTEVTPEVVERESEHSSEESGDEPDEIETLHQTVEDITTERDALQAQLQVVTQALEQKKACIKELWKISCGQVEEFDAMVVAKDKQIAVLKAQLAAQKQQKTPSSSDDDSVSSVTVSVWRSNDIKIVGVVVHHLLICLMVKIRQCGWMIGCQDLIWLHDGMGGHLRRS